MSLYDVIPGSPQGPRRRSKRAAEKRRKRRRRRTWVTLLVILVVLGGAGTSAWLFAIKPIIASINAPDDFPGPGTGSVMVKIPAGASGRDIAAILMQKGVVKTANAYLSAASENPASAGIQPGSYALKQQMSGEGAVEALLDPETRQVRRVTIPEGSRLKDILAKIASTTSIKRADLDAAAKDTAGLGLPAEAKGNLEGYLFPSTYDVEPGTSAEDLLRQMVETTIGQLEELGVRPRNMHRVMTLASIVQAEGRHPEDMGKIARVLDNRLASGTKLEVDTTIHYATGKFTVFTSKADLAVDSPYNTYKYPGLPPGPIGSPGLVAIKASLDPTPGKWMYFVAVNPDTGETRFAVTEKEREAYVRQYEAWQRKHPGK